MIAALCAGCLSRTCCKASRHPAAVSGLSAISPEHGSGAPVTGEAGKRGIHMCWAARCDCGAEHEARGDALRRGQVKSCGCLSQTVEGLSKKRPEYKVWGSMIDRCYRPKAAGFKHYGGRGITVCDRWRHGDGKRHGFLCFIDDVGHRQQQTHTRPDQCRRSLRARQCPMGDVD